MAFRLCAEDPFAPSPRSAPEFRNLTSRRRLSQLGVGARPSLFWVLYWHVRYPHAPSLRYLTAYKQEVSNRVMR